MGLYLQIVFFSCFLVVAETLFFDGKVDCLVSNWSPWSSPNEYGQSIRTSKLLRLPANGGRQCPPRREVKADCQVSNWSPWSGPDEYGQIIRTCEILRLPINGGRECPPIREVKDEGCICTTWSEWSQSFGFGQKSRTREWIGGPRVGTNVSYSQCHKVIEEDISYTGVKPTLKETAHSVLRPLGLNPGEESNMHRRFVRSGNNDESNDQILKVRDIVLILDTSSSIWRSDFDQAKQDAKSLFGVMCPENKPFDVNRNDPYQNHQLAMLTFSSSVQEIFNFKTYNKTSDVLDAITNARYIGGATNTASAFRKAKKMFQTNRGTRKAGDKVKREVLILTDGLSSRVGDSIQASKDLSKVADVYGLMIGEFSASGQTELTEYVSKPASKHLFNVKDFGELSKLVAAVKEMKKYDPYWCASFDDHK